MNKSIKMFQIIFIIMSSTIFVFPNGNTNNYELGTAIYRDLNIPVANNHWHTGVFNYFHISNGNYAGIYYTEHEGWNHATKYKSQNLSISVSNYENDINNLKNIHKDEFCDNNNDLLYHGAYSKTIQPSTRASIVATSKEIGQDNISYTFSMLKYFGSSWSGSTNDISDLRCDGVVEYSYEKNGIIVCKAYDVGGGRKPEYDNISTSNTLNVAYHNNIHNSGFNWGEMCPKIQSGEGHNASSWMVSDFDPLIASDPTISNFTAQRVTSSNPQLNRTNISFKVGDNASVKAYVLLQVKRTDESTWHVLKDQNNNIWKFKEVDLTDWNGTFQYDYFNIVWQGKFDGGAYAENDKNFNLKISVIDQGANTSSTTYSFVGEVPPLLTISPFTNNVGTVQGTSHLSGSFLIVNNGDYIVNAKIQTTHYCYDLDPTTTTTYEDIIYRNVPANGSITITYTGIAPAYYGTFTETITIDGTNYNTSRIHNVLGDIALPDFCYGETKAMAASPEELLFDKAFIDFYVVDTHNEKTKEKKSINERLDFAYKLLKKDKSEKVEDICKTIIELYPESEMGISFYAMGLLWEAAYSDDESPEFKENDFKKYLKKLTQKKDKYKINGYAQLILSLLDVGNDIEGLEKLFSDYEYDGLKELALFHQFIHYYIYKQDEETARKVSDQLDEMFVDSRYGYQAHLIFEDEEYTLEGLEELLKKKQESLLAKRGESINDILSEMPKEYKLFNNYPNPFNPSTTIKYSLPKVSNVKLRVYNMMGQLIKTLVSETKPPGFYNVEWNGTNENNSSVASGIYFYRFESDSFIANNKMILIK